MDGPVTIFVKQIGCSENNTFLFDGQRLIIQWSRIDQIELLIQFRYELMLIMSCSKCVGSVIEWFAAA